MNAIFPIITIFIFVLILFFLSQLVIKIIWNYQKKLNPTKTIETWGSAIALFFWFIILMLGVTSAINIFVNVGESSSNIVEAAKPIEDALNLDDCSKLIDTIYIQESKIYNLENHRYLEIIATPKVLSSDYQKGAEVLEEAAKEYLQLDLNPESEYYSQIIANKLQEKAQLFEQRSKSIASNKEQQKVVQLLDKMDSVTQKRLKAIASIEEQCNAK